ncbi:gamma-glutamylcyclotransferase family protein [Leeuwenhoekiella marinoflava]|uniref:Gamma-glutamyl AIG2-like cyclotransferase n=2 Tax=Leeuwenhoekiella marinoflava TaxID=988 RepID=A0A4Q0PLW6_9FLAO|nr:gamma-glutamylcyclotransferase family protein [Leeuwenhoekiella marinoflava]RXG29983.1 gamma-glutamyl AIG2-like cyclotransferase [Leeuwenhoekiella marinoflava]SHF24439.1 Gamma-glutamyl cyclotransferase, AIG2-like [Leeuwenhoekiella marinoflava DSM 3653]
MPLLFTYGTLQDIEIQKKLFGRKLDGEKDILKKYKLGTIKIPENQEQTQTYFIAMHTGNKSDEIEGTVYELRDFELNIADEYEGYFYKRKHVLLASNKKVIIYCKPDDK